MRLILAQEITGSNPVARPTINITRFIPNMRP